jgi:hypothetical protein
MSLQEHVREELVHATVVSVGELHVVSPYTRCGREMGDYKPIQTLYLGKYSV